METKDERGVSEKNGTRMADVGDSDGIAENNSRHQRQAVEGGTATKSPNKEATRPRRPPLAVSIESSTTALASLEPTTATLISASTSTATSSSHQPSIIQSQPTQKLPIPPLRRKSVSALSDAEESASLSSSQTLQPAVTESDLLEKVSGKKTFFSSPRSSVH
jgi:heme-binding NEAT domain protein